MITIKKIIFVMLILLLFVSYKGYIVYQDKISTKEKEILNDAFDEAVKSPVNDLKAIKHSNTLDKTFKRDIEKTREPILVKKTINKKNNLKEEEVKNKYKILGKIEIEKINYNGVIIENATKENLKIGICKVAGNGINQIGNLVLAGHNMKDGSLFSNLKLLEIGDTFKLIDNKGNFKLYKIYRKKVISPYDLSILFQHNSNEIKATLFTCASNGRKRLVLYASCVTISNPGE